MKKLIITCALVSIGSIASFAQAAHGAQPTSATSSRQAPSAEKLAVQRAQKYSTDLGLNNNQYQAVYDAQLDFIKQDQAMRANGAQPGTGQVQQLQMYFDQRMQNALSPEQFAKYEKSKAKTN